MIAPSDIEPRTLVARLLDAESRRALFLALAGDPVACGRAFEIAARVADGTPEELRRVVAVLLEEGAERAGLVDDLLVHPQMPEDVLLDLAERGICVGTLGHLTRSRPLLERMVARHAYPEAILSLALQLYRDPEVPCSVFSAHAVAHAGLEWMLRCLAEVDPVDDAKEAVYESLLAGSDAATAFHARHLACAERCDTDRLARFLARWTHPDVLVLLLGTEIADGGKRAVVRQLAASRTDSPEIVAALALRCAIDEAVSPELTPEQPRRCAPRERPRSPWPSRAIPTRHARSSRSSARSPTRAWRHASARARWPR